MVAGASVGLWVTSSGGLVVSRLVGRLILVSTGLRVFELDEVSIRVLAGLVLVDVSVLVATGVLALVLGGVSVWVLTRVLSLLPLRTDGERGAAKISLELSSTFTTTGCEGSVGGENLEQNHGDTTVILLAMLAVGRRAFRGNTEYC